MQISLFKPFPYLYIFYEGGEEPSSAPLKEGWLQEVLKLGFASYALVSREEALVFDTHLSPERGAFIRATLQSDGVKQFTVVLSHWHLDHIAGSVAFADQKIIASTATAAYLRTHQVAIETGVLSGPPAVSPLIFPTQVFEEALPLTIGDLTLQLLPFHIHSDDATVVWLPAQRLLLAGDCVEAPIMYVDDPHHIASHLTELDRLAELKALHIFPAHGRKARLVTGGYNRGLIRANQQYLRLLQRLLNEPELRTTPWTELIEGPLQVGWVENFSPYDDVHQGNLARLMAMGLV